MTDKNDYPVEDDEISRAFKDTARMTRILQAGIHEALMKHKLAGNPICELRDNKVVWIPPEEILAKK